MSNDESNSEFKEHEGGCHCRAVRYTVKLESLRQVLYCNCSICSRKAYLWAYGCKEFVLKSGEENVIGYTRGKLTHKFCGICGIAVLGSKTGDDGQTVNNINVRTLDDINLEELEVKTHDGASKGQAYHPPDPLVPESSAGEGLKVYNGNCHCGAVRIAVETKPFDVVKNCNCSHCAMVGASRIYPHISNVKVEGELSEYHYYTKEIYHRFCGKCGGYMISGSHRKTAVNTRNFNGLDWDKLKIVMLDNRSR